MSPSSQQRPFYSNNSLTYSPPRSPSSLPSSQTILRNAKNSLGLNFEDEDSNDCIQSESKPNLCRLCGKTYARPSTLKTHLRTHSGERPYRYASIHAIAPGSFPILFIWLGFFFGNFDFQLSWLQQKLLTSSQFNSTRAHTCKLKWILYEQKRSVLDWVDDQSHDSHVFSLRFLFSDDCFDCVWIVDGPEAISVSYLWSQIFTKFKCNNAHAHSFGRKTLSVSEYASLSELCVASFYCTKLVNASSLSHSPHPFCIHISGNRLRFCPLGIHCFAIRCKITHNIFLSLSRILCWNRCRACKKAFSDSSTLTKHLRIHSGEVNCVYYGTHVFNFLFVSFSLSETLSMQNVYATVTMPSIFYIHFSLIFFLHLNSFCHFCRLKYTHALQTLAAHVNRIDLETSSWASLNFMQCEQVQKETEYWFTLLVSCLSLSLL